MEMVYGTGPIRYNPKYRIDPYQAWEVSGFAGYQMIPPIAVHPQPPVWRDRIVLAILTLALLAPFLGKPAHIDDPMYLWTAKQIASHPLDFYNFNVNWEGYTSPIYQQMKNPPLLPYYLAAAAALLGWSEPAMHAALLPLSVLSILGMYQLSRRFCRYPLLPTIMLLFCPAFAVSSTTLMCEVPLLCFWIWAINFWLRGVDGFTGNFHLAGLLAGLAILNKYSGVCLLPLLLAHTILFGASKSKRVAQSAAMCIPLIMVLAYDLYTYHHYGKPLFVDAVGFSSSQNTANTIPLTTRLLDALIFIGGGALMAGVIGFIAGGPTLQAVTFSSAPVLIWLCKLMFLNSRSWSDAWGLCIQAALLCCAGICVSWLCFINLRDSIRSNSRDAAFLMLWIVGVFVFAAVLNWSINVRSILPMLPPICILTAREVERRGVTTLRPYVLGGVTAAIVAALVAVADYQSANASRWAAHQVVRRYGNRNVWFIGHWGFQYYLEQSGVHPLDEKAPRVSSGDIVIVPFNNYGNASLGIGMLPLDAIVADNSPFLATQNQLAGAGFYFSAGDRLPFVFGNVPSDRYEVMQVVGGPPSTLPAVGQLPLGNEKGDRDVDENRK